MSRRAVPLGPGRTLQLLLGLGLAIALSLPVLFLGGRSEALPQYTARSARTCDNCHVEPTGWENPAYGERICTLSCSGCHVDPAGGGLRTVSGWYFGTQTLPAFGADRRPWADRDGHLFGLLPGRDWQDDFWSEPEGGSAPSNQPTSRPSSRLQTPALPVQWAPVALAQRGPTSRPSADETVWEWREPDIRDWSYLAWGTPGGEAPANAYHQDRYAGLLADPLLRIGGDFRYAALKRTEGWTFFPMQFDIGVGLHPVQHLTLYVEGAAWGGQTGAGTQINGADVDLFGLHETFLMTHEWPMNAYLKVGRFFPQFGTRLDDHTAFVRRNLGLDPSRPNTWVSGVEAGFNANYPYLNVAAFRLDAGQHDFWPDHGNGISANAGIRELWYGLGGSFWWSDGDAEQRMMAGLNWYLNPWRWWPWFPFTYLGELDWANVDSVLGGAADQVATFHELDWRPLNGVNFRFRYDFFDPDVTVASDHQHRLTEEADVSLYRHTELQFVVRQHFSPVAATTADFFTIFRLWL